MAKYTNIDNNNSDEQQPTISYYKSFEHFCTRIKSLKLANKWSIIQNEQYVLVKSFDSIHSVPENEIYVDNSLQFTIRVFCWSLPISHEIYREYKQSVNNITLSQLIDLLAKFKLCQGTQFNNFTDFYQHTIPKPFTPTNSNYKDPLVQTIYMRSNIASYC